DIDHGAKAVVGKPVERRDEIPRRARNDNVDLAMRGDGLCERRSGAVMIAHILCDADTLAALFAAALSRRLDLLRRAGDDGHRRASLRQPRCDLEVDAARRPRNESGLAGQQIVAKRRHVRLPFLSMSACRSSEPEDQRVCKASYAESWPAA